MKGRTRDRTMREHPDIEQLKRQAKELLDAFIAAEPDALDEVSTRYRGADAAKFALHDASWCWRGAMVSTVGPSSRLMWTA